MFFIFGVAFLDLQYFEAAISAIPIEMNRAHAVVTAIRADWFTSERIPVN